MSDKQDEVARLQEQIARLQAQVESLSESGRAGSVASDVRATNVALRDQSIHVQAGVYIGALPESPERAEAIYRAVVAERCGVLPLRGADASAGEVSTVRQPLSLARVYIDLDTTRLVSERVVEAALRAAGQHGPRGLAGRAGREGAERDEDVRPLSALEATVLHGTLVLVGDPGSGKSTFVHHLTHALARRHWEKLPQWPERETLPIPVVLRDYARWLAARDPRPEAAAEDLLWEFVAHDLKQRRLAFAPGLLERALDDGRALVLLDGLDEVPPDDEGLLELVRESVRNSIKRYGKSRHLVTCRVLSYREPRWQLPKADYPAFELAPFTEEDIDRFIGAWYEEVGEKWRLPMGDAERLAAKLREAVRRPDLWRLAPNPLLLTVMALVHTHRKELPEKRALLYGDAVDILLLHWEQHKDSDAPLIEDLLGEVDRDRNDLRGVLERLAFEAHGEGSAKEGASVDATGIDELTLLQGFARLHPKNDYGWSQRLLETLRLRASLLLERKGRLFTFPHRTFQEYLAAVHLAHRPNFGREAAGLADRWGFWREVVLLAVGYLVHGKRENEKPLSLVRALCPAGGPRDDGGWRKAWLAGEALLEIGVNRAGDDEVGVELLARVRGRLVDLVEKGVLSPQERAEAGDVLGRLDDARFDPDLFGLPCTYRGEPEPLAGVVEVRAGPFVMGSREDDPGASSDEHGNPESLRIDDPYWIARYPVTVSQFDAFVQAGGYEDRTCWTELGWQWRQGEWDSRVEEDWLRDRLRSRPPEQRAAPMGWNEQRPFANRPVHGVSWFEAMAYCAWLDTRLRRSNGCSMTLPERYRLRLPTEAQWEKALRHGDERPYPWGAEGWDERRANIESTVGRPTTVGMYPRGATPAGLHDGAGNVWEWTASLFAEYPYDPRDGRDDPDREGRRVVRGGSWSDNQWDARCAYRGGYAPGNFNGDLGFRVVLSLANSEF
jgi:formylglycine-generating enzyme required for sulfatase activity